jgi:hypothetical protein
VAISGPELATPAYQRKKTAFGRRVVSDEGADYRLHHQNPLAPLAEVPQPLIVEKKQREKRTKLLENILEVDILYACLDSNVLSKYSRKTRRRQPAMLPKTPGSSKEKNRAQDSSGRRNSVIEAPRKRTPSPSISPLATTRKPPTHTPNNAGPSKQGRTSASTLQNWANQIRMPSPDPSPATKHSKGHSFAHENKAAGPPVSRSGRVGLMDPPQRAKPPADPFPASIYSRGAWPKAIMTPRQTQETPAKKKNTIPSLATIRRWAKEQEKYTSGMDDAVPNYGSYRHRPDCL